MCVRIHGACGAVVRYNAACAVRGMRHFQSVCAVMFSYIPLSAGAMMVGLTRIRQLVPYEADQTKVKIELEGGRSLAGKRIFVFLAGVTP